jgi:hypothetical protein
MSKLNKEFRKSNTNKIKKKEEGIDEMLLDLLWELE